MPFAIAGRLENPRVIDATDEIAGVQDATKYGAACPQQELVSSPLNANQPNSEVGGLLAVAELLLAQNITDQSEDCLSINVQVPHGYQAGDNLPVMMWIYGGGSELGSSAALGSEATALEGDIYQGANIVARSVQMGQPVVFVSANYCLNAFGGLASQEIKDAGVSNLMLKDQRVAMQWVQKYIANFGSDPERSPSSESLPAPSLSPSICCSTTAIRKAYFLLPLCSVADPPNSSTTTKVNRLSTRLPQPSVVATLRQRSSAFGTLHTTLRVPPYRRCQTFCHTSLQPCPGTQDLTAITWSTAHPRC